MIFAGIDPDMHTCAIATVNEDLTLVGLTIMRVTKKLKTHAAISAMCSQMGRGVRPGELTITAHAVEAQEIYMEGPNKTPNPRNILHLAAISGAALTMLAVASPTSIPYFPLPVQWKGSIEKIIQQRRYLAKAGFQLEQIGEMGGKEPYCYIKDYKSDESNKINDGDWKHLTDAIGLAQYAAKEYMEGERRKLALARARGNVVIDKSKVYLLQPHSGRIN
jgi:hypothetical protein